MRALAVHAGPTALAALGDHGLRPEHVRVVPAAAGGPKGLILNPLDRYLFGRWLASDGPVVHLTGASIGAWRLAAACLDDPAEALAAMAEAYVDQRYEHAPGRRPTAEHVSGMFAAELHREFDGRVGEVLTNSRFRLHVFTSRGRHLLARDGRRGSRVTTPLAHLGAFASNAISRRALAGWWERVVFSDPRDPLPLRLDDFPGRVAALDATNFAPSILASCSIPGWLRPVRDIPGAPRGAYWDGGITDYHLHLDYASIPSSADAPALALYPHFEPRVLPGWLDKFLPAYRHRATPRLSNVILLSPRPEWVATLPNGKLPDRTDFLRYGDDSAARAIAWRGAIAESERLADEFAAWVDGGRKPDLRPLT